VRTVQLTIDEQLLQEVDSAVRKAGTSRSAFTREALRHALERSREQALERKHREGYRRKPVKPSEFKPWENEQSWGET
jgi:metal-responsive CopG/Arc/MetJ family transcriptional regulator